MTLCFGQHVALPFLAFFGLRNLLSQVQVLLVMYIYQPLTFPLTKLQSPFWPLYGWHGQKPTSLGRGAQLPPLPGKGCTVAPHGARSDSALCPVTALMTYLRIRGMAPGPLFVYSDGSPLSKSKLNKKLQHVLSAAGWQGRFTLHSFRVGAASTAASLGFPDHLIKALGRRSSEAYQVYIRLPQNRLVSASKSLASAVSFNGS